MRKFLMAAMAIASVQGAQAADMPALRGSYFDAPASRPIWEGFYVGGQGGYGVSNMNFAGSTTSQIARLLANTTIENEMRVSQWPLLGKESRHAASYGGFMGYNSQWDDVVIGVDFSYMHGKSGGTSTGSMGRSFTTSDGYNNNVTATSTATIAVSDFGSIRLRGGYAIDNYLPYMFAGFALGRADIVRSASITAAGTYVGATIPAPPDYGPDTVADTLAQHGHLLVGYSAGAGLDIMLAGGLFFRAEYEYLRFAAPIDTSINTVRAGLGYKF